MYARRGLPAGDIVCDLFVKAYALDGFDKLIEWRPNVCPGSYSDDNALTAVGSHGQGLCGRQPLGSGLRVQVALQVA